MKRQSIFAAFVNSFHGLRYFLLHERNGRIQAGAAVVVIVFGVMLHISANEWLAILLCIGAVISLEMLNSAIEKLCDHVHKEYHPTIKIIKDVAAGAVSFTAIISIVVACIIFLPKMFSL